MFVHRNKNSLSQNFIKSAETVCYLLDSCTLSASDLVLEIGPGKGIITTELVKRYKQVVAVEKDERYFKDLLFLTQSHKNFKLYNADFLSWTLPQGSYKIFSNIPFSITSEIIAKLVKSNNQPDQMYFIMQREAALKYAGGNNETQSSILVKPWYKTQIITDINRTCFVPKPQVNISFIEFIKHQKSLIEPNKNQIYRDFVIYGFNQWKPTLIDSFKNIFSYNQIKLIKKRLKINNQKPSQINLNQWIELFNIFEQYVPQNKKDTLIGFEKKYLKRVRH